PLHHLHIVAHRQRVVAKLRLRKNHTNLHKTTPFALEIPVHLLFAAPPTRHRPAPLPLTIDR
ncbi:MAG: hypothetical protein KDE24_34560, partial [Caldilinea sp.]|nr:hypothetical protein [Caldilinea sp.]